MAVHPDKTAFRAVDACGGTYSSAQHATNYAQGHKAALDAACEAVAKADALTNELLEALKVVTVFAAATIEKLGLRDTNNIIGDARAAIAKAEGGQ